MIYIQSDPDRKMASIFDSACAQYAADIQCMSYRLTSMGELTSGKFDRLLRTNLFVGSTEFMQEVFRRAGVSPRLPKNFLSEERLMTLGEALEVARKGKIFIKPVQNKLFSGCVATVMDISSYSPYPLDTPVITMEPYEQHPLSEWRCYVLNRKVVDSHCYSGDFRVTPDWKFADHTAFQQRDFPSAYVMDLAVFSMRTAVVEFNDMWAIGNYGMDNTLYLRMLRQRYFEIMKGPQEEPPFLSHSKENTDFDEFWHPDQPFV